MKAFCILLFSLLFSTAGVKQQGIKYENMQNPFSILIDFPAAVMINHKKQDIQANHNVVLAQKIFSAYHIPVFFTDARQIVFVKINGDKIFITANDLAEEYDIILFNAEINPVPLKIADLPEAAGKIFGFDHPITAIPGNRIHFKKRYIPKNDTVYRKISRNRFSQLRIHDKQVVVPVADTSSIKLITRTIPGIEWIEQRVDSRTILKINFENDLITYANTDRYFTNGITFDLQSAWLSRLPVQQLMIPYRHKAYVTYNLNMVQDIYTPADTRVEPLLHNDRPYASYLYFGFRKTVADPLRKLKLSSQLDAGYIGPHSPGSYLQTLVHKVFPTNDKPLGWETQIKSDLILSYTILVQKALISKEYFSLLAGTDVIAGTLYNKAGAGFQFQAGKAEPVFGLAENGHWQTIEYYFFGGINVGVVAYNALLQGGLFNQNNIFTLSSTEIQRVVGNAEAGIRFRYKGLGIELAQHYLSPEFKGCLWHKWGRISLLVKL